MQVHFIGLGEINMFNLAIALHKKGETVTGSDETFDESLKAIMQEQGLVSNEAGWFSDRINDQLDAVVLGVTVERDNPELMKAKELGLRLVSYPEFLYELGKFKTRVVISGSQRKSNVVSMILHVLAYNEVEADYALTSPNGIHLTKENDFMVIEGNDGPSSVIDTAPQFHKYQPNIALLSDIEFDEDGFYSGFEAYSEQYGVFVDSIVKGGSITYNDEDVEVKKRVESSENPIRKFPYATPVYQEENGQVFLDTPDGDMPLDISGETALSNLAGAKWICQQMGVDEVEFYEAMAAFH
ncbi:Mur ligase domain-containing protein [Muricauda sp. 334s03]|uniref:Mur ligase domain-containing protein n=1 Tax=Flagellimonas yonaguniensis TaxID=3031325 RepID=A0ABT5Y324_9FLAO|nr:Mur ligase domain-containing protein [[Muricauda] yonaguniensis]MDF0717848.1 Mur ligase domain-containing protein [[Muricauda] yonaguniensis]